MVLGVIGSVLGGTGWYLVVLDSAAVSIFVVILVELTNTVFVNSTNITTNIETAVLFRLYWVSMRQSERYLVSRGGHWLSLGGTGSV